MPRRRTLVAVPPPSKYVVQHYKKSRFWEVTDAETLICITVYRKGAREVVRRLEELDHMRLKFDTLRLVADMVEEIPAQFIADR